MVPASPDSQASMLNPDSPAMAVKSSRVCEVATDSGMACGLRQFTRMPLGPSSPARIRESASRAAAETPFPKNLDPRAARLARGR